MSDAASTMSVYSGDTAVHASTRATTPSPEYGPIPGLNEDLALDLDAVGQAAFDRRLPDGTHIKPRRVTELHWCSEQSGDMHEYVVIKVCDTSHDGEFWIRFKAYSGGGVRGDVAYTMGAIIPRESSSHASLEFVNGIEYRAVLETRQKMARLFRTPVDQKTRAYRTAIFIGMLSLHIGDGVGQCNPQDLCEIWPSLPDSDRRLYGFRWYELADGSGIEYLVLHVAGTSEFTTSDNWWVRLERTEMVDQATISANQDKVIHDCSELKHEVTFQAGIPFERVIEVLRNVPTGFNFIIEDCWFYTSTIAHRLSMEASDDLCECRTEDLCEIWSGERGSQMLVNRVQYFQGDGTPEYLLLNVSLSKHDLRGLWVRLEQVATIGRDENWASVSRNRRRLIEANPVGGQASAMVTDITFETLKFGQVTAELKRIDREMAAQNPIRAPSAIRPVEIVRGVTQLPNVYPYCVSGDLNDLLDRFRH